MAGIGPWGAFPEGWFGELIQEVMCEYRKKQVLCNTSTWHLLASWQWEMEVLGVGLWPITARGAGGMGRNLGRERSGVDKSGSAPGLHRARDQSAAEHQMQATALDQKPKAA